MIQIKDAQNNSPFEGGLGEYNSLNKKKRNQKKKQS